MDHPDMAEPTHSSSHVFLLLLLDPEPGILERGQSGFVVLEQTAKQGERCSAFLDPNPNFCSSLMLTFSLFL
jgi:hypothetical protein